MLEIWFSSLTLSISLYFYNYLFQASKQINILKDHHRWILGKQGQRLKDLEKTTATKINVPGVQDQSDIITITGTKDGIEKAEHEIRVISDEQVVM